jgi:hypothetical protein
MRQHNNNIVKCKKINKSSKLQQTTTTKPNSTKWGRLNDTISLASRNEQKCSCYNALIVWRLLIPIFRKRMYPSPSCFFCNPTSCVPRCSKSSNSRPGFSWKNTPSSPRTSINLTKKLRLRALNELKQAEHFHLTIQVNYQDKRKLILLSKFSMI